MAVSHRIVYLLFAVAAVASAGCSDGVVGKIRRSSSSARRCIDACQGSCGALGRALDAYLTKGGAPAATEAICQEESAFHCYVTGGTRDLCSSLIDKAASMGFALPRSNGELARRCGRGAAALEDASTTAAEAEKVATPQQDASTDVAEKGQEEPEADPSTAGAETELFFP
mmetsp:Transcript_99610/g.214930  ORF Transcript_99610/g.214930 Transcript_99610/m.214930 type:complete len:171 (+) Transcript_99610:99-611(+)